MQQQDQETGNEGKKIVFRNLTNVKFQQLKNAISKDKERPHFRGVYLDMHEACLVVTDSQIVMCYDIELMEENELKQILIDPKIFNQSTWLSVPKDDLQLVEFHCTEEKTEVKLGEDVVAVAKNIDTENAFPNYRHVFKDDEENAMFSMNKEVMKRLVSCLPSIMEFPIFSIGRKVGVICETDHFDFGKMKVRGIGMTVGFGEDEITNETIEVKINRDKDGKVFSGEFKKVEGKKLSRRVLKSWDDEFIDEDSGEAVTIPRNEIVVDKNIIIDAEVFETIAAVKEIEYLFIHKYDN